MNLRDALALGRVSNLPTVWTNMLAGIAVVGGGLLSPGLGAMFVALTLFYVGGMYLNDFFDRGIDARERPERPIPSGRVSATVVGGAGGAMLLGGIALAWLAGQQGGTGGWPAMAGIALAGCILLYDVHHKRNPLSPLVMGGCRMLVYVCAACVILPFPPASLWIAALVLLCYLIGLTYIAKQENLGSVANLWPLLFLAVPLLHGVTLALREPMAWLALLAFAAWLAYSLRFVFRRGPGDIPRAVVSLIAGMSLFDAMLVAGAGAPGLALLCVAGFALTLIAQRFIAGT